MTIDCFRQHSGHQQAYEAFARALDRLPLCRVSHPYSIDGFLLTDIRLGTSGSVDGSGRLIIKGRFVQRAIESVLRRYIGMLAY